MTAEYKDQPIRSNRKKDEVEDEMMGVMNGPSMFESYEDEYLEPGETIEIQEEAERKPREQEESYLEMRSDLAPGRLISAPVVSVKEDHVLVDVGDKSEGFVDIREFPVVDGVAVVKLGDVIEVVVKGHDASTGQILLSYAEARRRRAMHAIDEALRGRKPVKGQVTRTVKGGLIVDVLGTTAFLPASQIDFRRIDNFDEWIGKEIEGYIIENIPEKRRVILSRRQFLESERDTKRREIAKDLHVGQVVKVTVRRIVDFGVFVDLNGLDGLIPRSEVSWQRNARPEDFIAVGCEIEAKIIELDIEKNKVTLSRRQLTSNPWDTAPARYAKDTVVNGKIASVTSYGAFVRLEEGVDGMIHVSDMAWDAAGRQPSSYVAEGQEVEAIVLSIDSVAHRISLGLKQLTKDPWADMSERYPKGMRVTGKVKGLTKYGAFVELEPGVEGMIHVSSFSWDQRVDQPRDMLKKGDDVTACVLDVDVSRRRISLGIKQLTESPLQLYLVNHNIGDEVEGEVISFAEFGAFVKLAENVEGFIHISVLDRDRVSSPSHCLKVGETVVAKILKIDEKTGKISLDRRQVLRDQDQNTFSAYMSGKKKEGASLLNMGELLDDLDLTRATKEAPPASFSTSEAPAAALAEVFIEPVSEAPATSYEETTPSEPAETKTDATDTSEEGPQSGNDPEVTPI